MLFAFLIGFVAGAAVVVFVLFVVFLDPWGEVSPHPPFIDQFPPVEIDQELKRFLATGEDGLGVSRLESCFSLSLLLHMVFQEHKDSRGLRRWLHKRLQVELNDVMTRSQLGRLVQEIRILDLSLGTKFPLINKIRVEKFEMSDDKDTFEKIQFLVDMDYTGGFETSIGVWAVFKSYAHISLKVTRLKGTLRLILSRQPYNHWIFSFIADPVFEFDVKSQVQGHQLKTLIPVITKQIRASLRRKHVWPNYKIRYRPIFPNPLLQPYPLFESTEHIKVEGGLEVTVLQCTRLKTSILPSDVEHVVYASCSLSPRPFVQRTNGRNSNSSSIGYSLLIYYHRYDTVSPSGLTFEKNVSAHGLPAVRVAQVMKDSLAEKANFKPGDVIMAINNVPVRYDRQVTRQLQTLGELIVLVERKTRQEEESEAEEESTAQKGPGKETTIVDSECLDSEISVRRRKRSTTEKSSSPNQGSRRHSYSQFLYSSSLADDSEQVTDSLCSSLHDIPSIPAVRNSGGVAVQRTESARVPHLLVSLPSVDLRRTRSESQLLKNISLTDKEEEDEVEIEESAHKKIEGHLQAHLTLNEGLILAAPLNSLDTGSSISSFTSHEFENEEEVEEQKGGLSRTRSGSARNKLRNTLQAGKRKTSPTPSEKKANCEDKKKKKNGSRNGSRSPCPPPLQSTSSWSGSLPGVEPPPSPRPPATSLSTRPVHLSPNVIWGQSLHFQLDAQSTSQSYKYLNVTIHAKQVTGHSEQSKTVILGHSSLYIPQVIDDCQLTLSNAHREVFHLRPPPDIAMDSTSEFSRRAGFDPLLCFGDVTLRFRYFKTGLPKDSALNPGAQMTEGDAEIARKSEVGKSEQQNQRAEAGQEVPASLSASSSATALNHPWKAINSQKMCGCCKGKIWMRQGVACSKCLLVSHQKCQVKADTTINCATPLLTQEAFAEAHRELFGETTSGESGGDSPPSSKDASVGGPSPTEERHTNPTSKDSSDTSSLTSRRSRLKSKVTEKFSSWRRKKTDKDIDAAEIAESSLLPEGDDEVRMPCSPSLASVQSALADLLPSLEGSPHLAEVFFLPGNAYNEDTIANAKRLGQNIFCDLSPSSRRESINRQIDKIHHAIKETKDLRLKAMLDKNMGVEEEPATIDRAAGEEGTAARSKPAANLSFAALDNRLQALAVLMLHYCAALQDCNEDTEGDEISLRESGKPEAIFSREITQHDDISLRDTTSSATSSLLPTPTDEEEVVRQEEFPAAT